MEPSSSANLIAEETCGTIRRSYHAASKGNVVSTTHVKSGKWSLRQLIYEAFLPEGYPDSVSDDYLHYQIFDSIQALCSSFTGTLSTKAILTGVGVGNAQATSTAAITQWIIRDGSGMIGRILFAWTQGSNLDNNAKTWRFMADILNDIAMTLEIMVSSFPSMFLPLVCTGSVLKAIVGMAGGATRAALTQHQARRGNIADVSAKDGTQETALVLVGMALSLIITPLIGDSIFMTWFFFILFTILHLASNYLAVRGIRMEKFNRQRLRLAMETFLQQEPRVVPSPAQIASLEKTFAFDLWDPILLGVPFSEVAAGPRQATEFLDLIEKERYGLWVNTDTNDKNSPISSSSRILVVLHSACEPQDVMRAYFHARLRMVKHPDGDSYSAARKIFGQFCHHATTAGWNCSDNLLGSKEWRVTPAISGSPADSKKKQKKI